MNKDYIVVDNFLSKEELTNLNNIILSFDFPWYKSNILREIEDLQFSHKFFINNICSEYLYIIESLLKKLNCKQLIKAKANALLKTDKIKEHGFHVDFEYDDLTTAVYYCNTNNGYTKLFNGDIINSIENRILIFKANTMHTGTTCTDYPHRTVINLNYK